MLIQIKWININKCSFGAYEVFRSRDEIVLTILASGSEVNLALDVSHKLATDGVYSKVVSVPCQELFDKQADIYKSKILDETNFTITIEAGSTSSWKKYIVKKGLNFGIDNFGKSAPYKEIYNFFGLNLENIINKTKNLIKS